MYDLAGWNLRSMACGPNTYAVAADKNVIMWGQVGPPCPRPLHPSSLAYIPSYTAGRPSCSITFLHGVARLAAIALITHLSTLGVQPALTTGTFRAVYTTTSSSPLPLPHDHPAWHNS